MGKCKYCGQDCGWFSHSHDVCKQKYEQGVRELTSVLQSCFLNKVDFYIKEREIQTIIKDSFINNQSKEDLFVNVLDTSVLAVTVPVPRIAGNEPNALPES